jgi:fructokinase
LLQGPNGLSGEWGHNQLPILQAEELPGPRCYCGRQGCIESWISGPGLVADYQRSTGDQMVLDVPMLVSAARQNNPGAMDCLARHVQRLARALAIVINTCDPEVIVLGGGVSQRPGLIPDLLTALPAHLFLPPGTPLRTKILLPAFGDSSGVRGAARL